MRNSLLFFQNALLPTHRVALHIVFVALFNSLFVLSEGGPFTALCIHSGLLASGQLSRSVPCALSLVHWSICTSSMTSNCLSSTCLGNSPTFRDLPRLLPIFSNMWQVSL